jgi:hypothetical protein
MTPKSTECLCDVRTCFQAKEREESEGTLLRHATRMNQNKVSPYDVTKALSIVPVDSEQIEIKHHMHDNANAVARENAPRGARALWCLPKSGCGLPRFPTPVLEVTL